VYAWAVSLKIKSGNDVATVIAKIIRDDERCPKNLQTNRGKEFYNVNVQKLLKKHGINHYSTYSAMKASVVERFNRTLKNDMWKQFMLNGNYRWIDLLPQSGIRVQRAKASDNRYETYRRNSRDRR